jgi:2-iminobutanoate/2-iminopropanoate deaminase
MNPGRCSGRFHVTRYAGPLDSNGAVMPTPSLRRRPRSIEVPGIGHGSAPIPLGARVGGVVYSSGISGLGRAEPPASSPSATAPTSASTQTLDPANDGAAQVRQAFLNLCAFLRAAEVTTDDVVRLTVYLKDDALRPQVNAEWLALFPDPHDRPARHILIYALAGAMKVQLEVVAVDAMAGR